MTPDGYCFYCGCGVYRHSNMRSHKRPMWTRDHIIPKARTKGSAGNDLTVPACYSCNTEKGSLTIEEYRVVLAFRYGWIQDVDFRFPGES